MFVKEEKLKILQKIIFLLKNTHIAVGEVKVPELIRIAHRRVVESHHFVSEKLGIKIPESDVSYGLPCTVVSTEYCSEMSSTTDSNMLLRSNGSSKALKDR